MAQPKANINRAKMQKDLTYSKPKKEHLSARVAKQIQDKILEGYFAVDTRLPAERNLAELLGVSRNIVREATKVLQERGLVQVQSGSGVYVCAKEPQVIARSMDLFVRRQQITIAQLYEARWIIEIQTARLAAERATSADLKLLADCIKQSQVLPDGSPALSGLDVKFHYILAQTTHNPTLPLLLEPLTESLERQCDMTAHLPGAKQNALYHHERIYQAVAERDAQGAYVAMSDHLQSSWAWLLRVMDKSPEEIGSISFSETEDMG